MITLENDSRIYGKNKIMKKYSVQIVIATHKKYKMPIDKMYIPVFVGAEGKKEIINNPLFSEYARDNDGDNISSLNYKFCELTGLYWAWKNLDSDYIGLVHYRRHFSLKKRKRNLLENVLSYSELKPLLGKYKIFVPRKQRYYIETLYSHYAHCHYSCHIDETRKIISENYPEYLNSFDRVVNQTYGYMFNMMIMQKEFVNEYCKWIFNILFDLDEKIGLHELSTFQGRYCGRISEILFNVWLDYKVKDGQINRNEIKELSYIHMEKINWCKKWLSFIKAKFFKQKYTESF